MPDIKKQKTGEEPEPLTPKKMKEWNLFLDYIKSKGYEGSAKLDKDKALGQSLLNEFKKANPGITMTYAIVPTVQNEMQKLKQNMQEFEARKGNPNAEKIMANVSKVDGFLGSKTSQFRFPQMVEEVYHNTALQSKTNMGLIDGNANPTGVGAKTKLRLVPKGVKLEPLYDAQGKQTGMGYEDENGDIVKYQ